MSDTDDSDDETLEIDQELLVEEAAAERLLSEGSVVVQRDGERTPLRPKTLRLRLKEQA